MSDYQAIYDAVRSRISGGNVGDAVERVARDAFDISYAVSRAEEAIKSAAYAYERPSAVFKPALTQSPEGWLATYGACYGYGDTPDAAMWDFDKNWREKPAAIAKATGAE